MAARPRPINGYDVIQEWARIHRPACAFAGRTRTEFERWRRAFRRHYRRMLGPWPERVPLRPEITESLDKGDHIRHRVVFDSAPGVSVPAFLLVPKGLGRRERRPALLAAHGHGAGKGDVAGATAECGTPEAVATMERLHYTYGLEAVRRGYVVIAPDWLPFGERRPPAEWSREPTRDPCNVLDLAMRYFGRPLLTQNVWDGMRALDVLAGHPNVDANRLGAIGLSYGGTMTTHLLICDRRLRVGVVSGYVSSVRGDALNMRGAANFCGAQHVSRLLLYGDLPDIMGLACPKPILCEMGRKETCFHFPDMDRSYRRLRRIYAAAGFPERLARDVHPHDHRWSGRAAWRWLERWLA